MPGPDIIYVIMLSITRGKKYGIITSLGLVSGILIHTTLIAFGVAAIINESDVMFTIIKIMGALYLFYLAFKTFKSSINIEFNAPGNLDKSFVDLYKQGFIMNVLNPKVVIFFLAFLPGFVEKENGNITFQIYFLGIIFMIQAFIIFTLVSISSAKLTSFIRGSIKFEKVLYWLQLLPI